MPGNAGATRPHRPGALEAIGVAHDELAGLVEQMVERTADVAASVAPVLAARA